MSPQAVIVAIVYILSFAASLTMTIIQKELSAWYLSGMFISILLITLLVYDTHCLTSLMPCDVWSWIRTSLYCIIPITYLIFWGYDIHKKDEKVKLEWDLIPSSKAVPSSSASAIPSSSASVSVSAIPSSSASASPSSSASASAIPSSSASASASAISSSSASAPPSLVSSASIDRIIQSNNVPLSVSVSVPMALSSAAVSMPMPL